ncbi:MAG: type II toxin-antitoxin system Phd/YefM family antitoxin [Deltaproteobacteria bacterium]|nr:type II toxin-antitoxin system Phd/YefM family antitoxin [Deltaproteobacteria bacterium]
MEIDPQEQIQSISEFRTNTEELLKDLTRLKTILLTQYGKARAILVDPEAYENQLDRLHLAEKILQGTREIEEGKGIPHAEVERLSKGWI